MGAEVLDAGHLDEPSEIGGRPQIGELSIDRIDDRDERGGSHYRFASIVQVSEESPDSPTFSNPAR